MAYLVVVTDVDFENQTVNVSQYETSNMSKEKFLEFVELKRKQCADELAQRIEDDEDNEEEEYTIEDLFEFNELELEMKLYYTHDPSCGYESFKWFEV